MEDKYISTKLFINGSWVNSIKNETIDINNPATGDLIGTVSHAGIEDLDLALDSAQRGFLAWKKLSAFERSQWGGSLPEFEVTVDYCRSWEAVVLVT